MVLTFAVPSLVSCSFNLQAIGKGQSSVDQPGQPFSVSSSSMSRRVFTMAPIFRGHSERVVSVVFSPDGKLIASASYDNTIKLWDPNTNQIIRTFDVDSIEEDDIVNKFHIESSAKLSFSRDGKILTIGNGYNALISWQVETGRVVRKSQRSGDYTIATAFSPDGSLFANAFATSTPSLSGDGFDGSKFEQIEEQLFEPAFLPDAASIEIWDVKTGQRNNTLSKTEFPISTAFSSDNRFLVSAGLSGETRLWNLNSRQVLRTWQGPCVAVISPDTEFVAGDRDRVIKVWSRKTGGEIHSFQGGEYTQDLVFSPDSKTLAVADSAAGTVTVWDLVTNREVVTLSSRKVWAVTINPSGDLIASANFDNTVENTVVRFKRLAQRLLANSGKHDLSEQPVCYLTAANPIARY